MHAAEPWALKRTAYPLHAQSFTSPRFVSTSGTISTETNACVSLAFVSSGTNDTIRRSQNNRAAAIISGAFVSRRG